MNPSLDPTDWRAIILRIFVAAVVGGVIGWNREFRGKPAGLRTHVLVSVGAALFVMVPLTLSESGTSESVSRVIQGVAAGIGFLGAGEILRVPSREPARAKVKGLTSAAAIWVAAALGAVAGCGMWRLAVVGCATTFVTLTALWRLERTLSERRRANTTPGPKRTKQRQEPQSPTDDISDQ